MWIYRTDQFEEDIVTYGLADFVETRSRRIRDVTTRAQVALRTRPYAGYLVTRHENFRLIGGVETVGDREVFVWYHVLLRGSPDYRDFPDYAKRRLPGFLNHPKLREFCERMKQQEDEASRPVLLPDEYVPWLQPIHPIFSTDDWDYDLVYETAGWVNAIRDVEEFRWREIHELVARVVDGTTEVSEIASLERSSSGWGVVVQRTEHKAVFLLKIVRPEEHGEVLGDSVPMGDAALRYARRAYPTWLLGAETMWFDIQRGTAYNLALSPEERTILRRVSGQTAAGSELPMFINGHAGSGKSTMLAYVFAGLCKMGHEDGVRGRPLFITYNAALLEKAKQATRKILDAHIDTGNRYGDVDLSTVFVQWRDYLLEMLPTERRIEFPREKRVDYDDFVLAWSGVRGKLNSLQIPVGDHSAETVWYVIRSLIKGSDSDGDLTPEDYEDELSREERTVSADSYREIYEKFYLQWYAAALRDRGLWDDQDLTRAVFESMDVDSAPKDVLALVIDEAQDFTRRELRLVTRTTAYVDYKIPPMGTGVRPPIIFAGDPLQTLSPTGFRWGAVQAGIYEEMNGLFGDDAAQPVFAELLSNYRSSKPIVDLANTVQLWRAHLFALTKVNPQDAWTAEESLSTPVKFIIEEIDEDQFVRFAADTVLIVPCEEGGEVRYVRADPLLSRMFPDASEKQPPATVFSASSIKGLEYEKVILFKFGEAARDIRWEPVDAGGDRNLQDEYFFNKFYVAVTRATQHLYVADTTAGDTALWSHFEKTPVTNLRFAVSPVRLASFVAEGVSLGHVEVGNADLEDVREMNPRDNANKTRDYARETRSSRKMRQAASYFRRAAEQREAEECEAYALQFEGELQAAGQHFARAMKPDDAWRCFWDSRSWADLENLAAAHSGFRPLQTATVRYMATNPRTLEDVARFATSIVNLADTITPGPAWSDAIQQFAEDAQKLSAKSSSGDAAPIASALEVLFEAGNAEVGPLAAKLFIQSGNRLKARSILSSLPGPMSPDRARLFVEIEGLPAALEKLAEAGLNADIRTAWIEKGRPYSTDWTPYVLAALSDPKQVVERIGVYLDLADFPAAAAAFEGHGNWGAEYAEIATQILVGLGTTRDIDALVDFIMAVNEKRLGRLTKAQMVGASAQALASSFEVIGWGLENDADMQALRRFVESAYRGGIKIELDSLEPEYAPALGALMELSNYHRWASRLYLKFAGASDPGLRNYCRRRYLFAVTAFLQETDSSRTRERAELQDEQHQLAKRWGIDLDQRQHRRASRVGGRNVADSAPQPKGSLGATRWSIPDSDSVLRIDIDDGPRDILVAARVPLQGGEPRTTTGVIEVSGSEVRLTIEPDILVAVEIGSEVYLTVSDGGEVLGTVLIARRSGSESPGAPRKDLQRSRRTTQTPPQGQRNQGARRGIAPSRASGGAAAGGSGQSAGRPPGPSGEPPNRKVEGAARSVGRPVKVFKLAQELGSTPLEVLSICEQLGFGKKRGNAQLTAEQAFQIRQTFDQRSP